LIRLLGKLAASVRRARLGALLRATRDAIDAIALRTGRPPLRVTVGGVEIRGFLRHRSFLAELGAGAYEPALRRAFVERLRDADLVLDVGAHTGLYALLAARERPDARVVAIEPDPYNAAALRVNVRGSGVDVVEKAASSTVGQAPFRQNLGTIGSSLVNRTGTGPVRLIEVQTTTIDAVAGSPSPRSVLLKLDVEGAELQALAGASATLRGADRVTAIVELNPRALEAGGATGADLVAALRGYGLEVKYIDETNGMLVDPGTADRKGNLLATRSR
jgi:FkbM family methyltransferase